MAQEQAPTQWGKGYEYVRDPSKMRNPPSRAKEATSEARTGSTGKEARGASTREWLAKGAKRDAAQRGSTSKGKGRRKKHSR